MAGSTKELIAEHNLVAKGLGLKEISQWKGSKEALERKITAMAGRAADNAKAGKSKPSASKRKKGDTIVSTAREAILAGKDNAEVLAVILKKHPGASTTPGCVRWYRSHIDD